MFQIKQCSRAPSNHKLDDDRVSFFSFFPPPFFLTRLATKCDFNCSQTRSHSFFLLCYLFIIFFFQFSVCRYYVAKNFEMIRCRSDREQPKNDEGIIVSGNQTTRKFTRPWKCCYCSLSPQQMCVSIRDGHIIAIAFVVCVCVRRWTWVTRMVIQKRGPPPTWKLSQLPPINYLISIVLLSYFFFLSLLYVTVWLWCT